MSGDERTYMWRGTRIDQMPREDLEAAFRELADEVTTHYGPGAIRERALARVQKIVRGEA